MFPSLMVKSSQRDTKLKPIVQLQIHSSSPGMSTRDSAFLCLDIPSTPLRCCQLPHVFSPGSLPLPVLLTTYHVYHQTSSKGDVFSFTVFLNHRPCSFDGSPTRQDHRVPSRSTASLPAFSVNFLCHTIQSPQPMKQCCPHPWWTSSP